MDCPEGSGHLRCEVVEFVARQVGVAASDLGFYDWSGRQIKAHRAEIRAHLGLRECSVADAGKLTEWLAGHVTQAERRPELVRVELLVRCREERIEPPTRSRIDRIVASALHQGEEMLFTRVASRLLPEVTARLEALIAVTDDGAEENHVGEEGPPVLTLIKADPGNVSLDSMLAEIGKLRAVRAAGLPAGLFADVAPRVVAAWRAQAMVESPSHLRAHPNTAKTLTLLAAMLHARQQEITDTLVDLLISTVHRINARAEKKVTEELVNAFKKVTGKENILFSIAQASLTAPDDPVRAVVYPAVSGGEQTLRELVHEYKTRGPVYRTTVATTLRASYTGHYRRGLVQLLGVLEFRSSNTTHRPVIEALELIGRYAAAGNLSYYPPREHVPAHPGLRGDWDPLVTRTDKHGRRRTVRMAYEVATFRELRERLRCKEIWVSGADRWRNPDEDLPADFEARRAEHYASLRKPLDAEAFTGPLREEMRAELAALQAALPAASWLQIAARPAGAIKLTPIEAAPEPQNLRRLKGEVLRRWGTVPLIDMLKEAVLRTGCLAAVTSVAGRGAIPEADLAERLLLAIYGYGTNTGIRAVAAGQHTHSEDDIRYVRRRYLTAEAARAVAIQIANATFAIRVVGIWGAGSTPPTSARSTRTSSPSGTPASGRGVLIYWHVERGSVVVHSQHLTCSASEVHAMVEGAIRHGTSMSVEANYTDSHGQSEIGFGITRLLGFDLLPRIKQINKVKLYRPGPGEPDAYPALAPALTRPIRWELITQQYDQMIKYASAIRAGTATAEAILRRFTRSASHPTYQAMLELGRVQKTIFAARYLRDRDLQREIGEGLNVIESWNRANSVIFYGKGGDIATNRRDEQEMAVLCLRILQAALVYVNTLMLQHVLADTHWSEALTTEDQRGLTPLFWIHVLPYGEVRLDMTSRLSLGPSEAHSPAGQPVSSPQDHR